MPSSKETKDLAVLLRPRCRHGRGIMDRLEKSSRGVDISKLLCTSVTFESLCMCRIDKCPELGQAVGRQSPSILGTMARSPGGIVNVRKRKSRFSTPSNPGQGPISHPFRREIETADTLYFHLKTPTSVLISTRLSF